MRYMKYFTFETLSESVRVAPEKKFMGVNLSVHLY